MKNEIDDRLALEFEGDAEWKAYQTRVARVLTKRNAGKPLTKEESAIIADYQIAIKLPAPPTHKLTGTATPPILYGYTEAEEAFGVTRGQLLGLRSRGCPAFVGNSMILTSTLFNELSKDPSPEAVQAGWHTGRKGKLTPELHASIVASLAVVPVLTTAAGAHGINASTLAKWREKGAAGGAAGKRYADFFNETEAAMEQARFGLVRDIATDPDWRAKLAILERTDPNRFGRVTRAELTGKDGAALTGLAPVLVNVTIEGVLPENDLPPPTPEPT